MTGHLTAQRYTGVPEIMKYLLPLLLACCIGCSHRAPAQTPPPDFKMHRVQDTSTRDASGWYVARSTEGHFTVLMPIPFNDFTIAAKDSDGTVFRTYAIGSKSEEGIKFSVTEAPYARKGIDPDLDALTRGFNGPGDTVTGVRKEVWEGHPAVSFRMDGRRSGACVRYVKTPARLLTLIIEFPKAYKDVAMPYEKPFFESLHLQEP